MAVNLLPDSVRHAVGDCGAENVSIRELNETEVDHGQEQAMPTICEMLATVTLHVFKAPAMLFGCGWKVGEPTLGSHGCGLLRLPAHSETLKGTLNLLEEQDESRETTDDVQPRGLINAEGLRIAEQTKN
jgi:hypothetical protein